MADKTVHLRVRKGVTVNVEEVDDVGADPDERVRSDRDAHIEVPLDLKLAVTRLPEDSTEAGSAVVLTTCG